MRRELWLLAARILHSLNAEAGGDDACGCPSREFDLSGSSLLVGTVVLRGIVVRRLSMARCGSCRFGASNGGKETGRYNDRWLFSRRQEFDAVPRSTVEGT